MPSKQRTLLIDAVTLSCPLILVMAVRTFFAPAPSQAGVPAAAQAPALIPVVASAKLTPEQQKAVDWLATLPPMAGLASPLDHPVAAPPPPPKVIVREPDARETAPPPIADPLAGLKLTAILGTDTGGLAAINGKVYKAGDTVRPGLTLKLIDARTNTVVLSQDDGTELKLQRKQQ